MVRLFPYLPVVKQAILTAQPRPSIINYDQASEVIFSTVYLALTHKETPGQALKEMATQLTTIIHGG
jgi:multiple sugar transport system substrate-binding protein